MANLKHIQSQIKSVSSIQKVTKAMKQKQRQKARELKNLAKDKENDQEQVNRDAVTEFYIGE